MNNTTKIEILSYVSQPDKHMAEKTTKEEGNDDN